MLATTRPPLGQLVGAGLQRTFSVMRGRSTSLMGQPVGHDRLESQTVPTHEHQMKASPSAR